MAILIADSGSTKTDWVLGREGGEILQRFQTAGINPYHQSVEEIEAIVVEAIGQLNTSPTKLFYYGAGCGQQDNIHLISGILSSKLQDTLVEVAHDLLGACRAVSGGKASIVAIMGTGSNTCLFDGVDIVNNIPALGYVLGDEGSGAHLGAMLIKKYLHDSLDKALQEKLQGKYNLSVHDILQSVYQKPNPNRYLASIAPFLRENIDHMQLAGIVNESFEALFELYVTRYKGYSNYAFNAVGSVAFHFRDALSTVITRHGMDVGTILQQPIDGLINFHLKN